jgi:predicted metal-dependent hydrolase
MNTEQRMITVSGLQVQIVRKAIKNLHLGVYPPHGRVRVAAPLAVSEDAVQLAVIGKLGWIKRQRGRFADQERQSAREYVSGESHYFQGSRYLLNVVFRDGPAQVILRNKTTMDLFVRPGTDTAQRERALLAWYRQQLKAAAAPLIAKWEAIVDVKVSEWRVKQMKTKWGACNSEERRIWLEAVEKPERG